MSYCFDTMLQALHHLKGDRTIKLGLRLMIDRLHALSHDSGDTLNHDGQLTKQAQNLDRRLRQVQTGEAQDEEELWRSLADLQKTIELPAFTPEERAAKLGDARQALERLRLLFDNTAEVPPATPEEKTAAERVNRLFQPLNKKEGP